MATKGIAFHRKESYEIFGEKDRELINSLEKITIAEKEKEYDNLDHSTCYETRKKIRSANNHICGGFQDPVTKKLAKKCLHCRFYFPVPKLKDVIKE